MNTKTILVMAAIIVVLGAGNAVAGSGGFWNGMMGGYGNGNGMMGNSGMMGSYGNDNGMMGNGSMMGSGGMMGGANGIIAGSHCGEAGNLSYGANAAPITIDEAKTAVEKYLAATGNNDLELAEVLQTHEPR